MLGCGWVVENVAVFWAGSVPDLPCSISSRRSSFRSCSLVIHTGRSPPPRRSGRTGHGTGPLNTDRGRISPHMHISIEVHTLTHSHTHYVAAEPTSEQLFMCTHGPYTHLLVDDVHPPQTEGKWNVGST